MSSRLVVVVGSVNVDYVLRLGHRPAPGETVSDGSLEIHPGGKGANQALAAARCGAEVEMVACVGADATGRSRTEDLAAAGVGTAHVRQAPDALTGVAFVMLTPDGENAIATAAGANTMLAIEDIEGAAGLIGQARVLVAQLEVPVAAVARAVELAGPETVVLVNCAPYQPMPAGMLARVDVLVANENEAAAMTGTCCEGVEGARQAGRLLLSFGPGSAVVTLGPLGAVVVAPGTDEHVPAPKVHVVDTTGAGDAFVGALAAHLAAGRPLLAAVRVGTAVGSATTEQPGASPVVPEGCAAWPAGGAAWPTSTM
jgi:ribokinase